MLQELELLPVQAFITATDLDVSPSKKHTVFHVEQGAVQQQDR